MGQPAIKNEHPYISRVEGTCGGSPIISGTRIPVWAIIGYHFNLNYSVERIIEAIPHITHAQIYDALSYYYDYKDEIDKELELNNNDDYWKQMILTKRGLKKKVTYEN